MFKDISQGKMAMSLPEFSSPCFADKIFKGHYFVLTDDMGVC